MEGLLSLEVHVLDWANRGAEKKLRHASPKRVNNFIRFNSVLKSIYSPRSSDRTAVRDM
jgi:hypothetical protein